MDYKNLLFEIEDGIAIITINRPEKLNALNNEVMDELKAVFERVKDDDEVRAVILTGSGQKAFVAGADIGEINQLDGSSGEEFSRKGHAILSTIENMQKPVIAAINGYALGGGCELAMACHIRLASENAMLGQPEVKLGIIPGYGGTVRLPRLIGKGKAMMMVLSGEAISAKEAKCAGLIDEVYPADELMDKAKELARSIARNGPLAVSTAIKAINEGLELGLKDAKALEAKLFGEICATEDMKEGTKAFLEKRKPEFKGK